VNEWQSICFTGFIRKSWSSSLDNLFAFCSAPHEMMDSSIIHAASSKVLKLKKSFKLHYGRGNITIYNTALVTQ
jgi:hypothetical protein